MRILKSTFDQILTARGFDIATLAERSGVSKQALLGILSGAGELSEDEIASVADELAVPLAALFAHNTVPISSVVDFRSATPRIAKFHKGTLQAISFVEKISNTLSDIGIEIDINQKISPISPDLTSSEAIKLAKKWRGHWGISIETQLEYRSANKLYVSLRSFIESMGILVIHRSFGTGQSSGFYKKVGQGPHVIVINTTMSSKARKLFTLAHEFCHVLLRQEGASNTSVIKNNVEKFCNKFAAFLLAPDELLYSAFEEFGAKPSADPDFIRIFSSKIGISQEALVLRLVEMRYIGNEDYARWRSLFNGQTPPGDLSDGKGGRSDPLQNKKTAYGELLISLLSTARQRGDLDEIDIYRICGLKPKYQNQLFEGV